MWQKERRRPYDGNHAVIFQKGVQTLQELDGEKIDGLRAAGEDVMHNVVVLGGRGFLGATDEDRRIFNGGNVVGRKVKVFQSELVHDGVDLHDGGFDAVRDERSGSGTDAETAGIS